MAEISAAQLDRILYILPVAARQQGVSVHELASALGVDASTVMAELEQAITRAYYHPAGWVDAFTISIEHERVHVHAGNEFQRPVRLNPRQALALGLGLRTLAAESAGPRRTELLALARRLEQELQAPDHEPQHAHTGITDPNAAPAELQSSGPPLHVELTPDYYLGPLADAIAQHQLCTISYIKPGADRTSIRRVAPLLLIYDRGRWYLAAHDLERDEPRMFRLDRMHSVDIDNEHFDPLRFGDIRSDIAERGFAYQGDEETDTEVRVRYSAPIARWLAEHVHQPCEPDGTLILTHRVADPGWLIRHVLQYGADAEVLAPPEARQMVHQSALGLTGASGLPE
jgi:predicted DNA-binding transcriptional regulator YafY